MKNVHINLHALIKEAVKHMESDDDLNWCIGAALWELLPPEAAEQADTMLKEGWNTRND